MWGYCIIQSMPSKKLQQYIAADKACKEAEAEREKLKAYVQKLLRRCKKMGVKVPQVSFSMAERFTFLEDQLYEWAQDTLPAEDFLSITKNIVDMEKLEELVMDGKINSYEIPETCYTRTHYYTTRVKHK